MVTEKTCSFPNFFPKSSKKSLGSGIWQKKNRVGRVTGNTHIFFFGLKLFLFFLFLIFTSSNGTIQHYFMTKGVFHEIVPTP